MQYGYQVSHVACLLQSFRHWTGHSLIADDLSLEEQAQALFFAPFAVVSHNTAPDPIFNYANQTALTLFEMSWEEFTSLPSRLSADPVHRDERAQLMAKVAQKGSIEDYRGVRISKSGRRFRIENTIIWNLFDSAELYCGQAAMFPTWHELE